MAEPPSKRTKADAENSAVWLYDKDDLRVEPYSTMVTNPLGPHEVRVQVGAVGICGSDVHYLKHMRIADFVVREPMVIGHESAGVVSEVGSEVTGLEVGDRVAMEPGVPCRRCDHCKSGVYNLCPDMRFFATPPVHGSLAEVVVHPADFCFKLPTGMTLEQGALCEPVAVAVHACRRAGVKPGDCVAVLGAGPIGLLTVMVAKAFGATSTAVTDVSDKRLEMALRPEVGADVTVNVSRLSAEDAAKQLQTNLGRRPDTCVDCCGMGATVTTALAVAKNGGRVCVVGMGSDNMELPLTTAMAREVDLVGVFRYRNAYPMAVQLISTRAIDVSPLITDRVSLVGGFDLPKIKEAFETSAKGEKSIKVMFNLLDEQGVAGRGA